MERIGDIGSIRSALWILLLVTALFVAPLAAQDPLDPDAPITIDFVQKDIHTVMHYIGLRSGLNITVEGNIKMRLTVIYRNVKPRNALRSICESNALQYIENGPFIYIKTPATKTRLANVTEGSEPGRYNVNFNSHALVQAIMETASVTRTEVAVPAVIGGTSPAPGDDGDAKLVDTVRERKISLYMRDATPDQILTRLKDLGDMRWKLDADKKELPRPPYFFDYKPLTRKRPGITPSGIDSGADLIEIPLDDPSMIHRSWTIPGAKVNKIKGEISKILSPVGRLVSDEETGHFLVIDQQDRIDAVDEFMQKISPLYAEKFAREAEEADDPIVVRRYLVTHDVLQGEYESSLKQILSDQGRLLVNEDDNSIVVWEQRSNMENVDLFIRHMDSTPGQVRIESKIIEVSLDEYIGYGLQILSAYSSTQFRVTGSPADGRPANYGGGSQDATSGTVGGMFGQPTGFDPFFATFNNGVLDVRLELLANDGRLRSLANPTVTVSNRRKATITVGQEVPYLQNTSTGGGTSIATVAFKEISIAMEVTPSILPGGLIRLDLKTTVKEQIGTVAIEGNNTPILSNRETETNVFLRDGETLVMGGLVRERERVEVNGIPLLMDIPILGYLFKSTSKKTERTDLLFFLRPTIITMEGPTTGGMGERHKIARFLVPIVPDPEDVEAADIAEGRYYKGGPVAKPPHFKNRPNKAKDVNPGG